MTIKSHTVELHGVLCRVEEHGNQNGPAIIMLHGWLDNSASFDAMLPYLIDFRVLTVDFPGHGRSEHIPMGMSYHFMDLVFVIQDVLNVFQLDSTIIIGHSMGGAAASLFSSVDKRVSRLVLIETVGPLTVSAQDTLKLMQTAIKDRMLLSKKEKPVYPSIELAVEVRASVSKIEPELIRSLVERGLVPYKGGWTWSSDPRLRVSSVTRLMEEQLEQLLMGIECPVLLIEADKGYFTNSELAQARKNMFNRLKTEVLEGGHHVHMEQPQLTVEAILAFLNECSV